MSLSSAWNDFSSIVGGIVSHIPQLSSGGKEIERVIVKEIKMARPNMYVRVAGLSGAIAVAMAAYGAHAFPAGDIEKAASHTTFMSGNRMHMIHTVALLGCGLTRRPHLVGAMLSAGMLMFSGSCYYHALTGDTRIRWITPYGGTMLIAAWLAMII